MADVGMGRCCLIQITLGLAIEATSWGEGKAAKELPKGPMGQPIGYDLSNRAALSRYLEAGSLVIDNDAAERALRQIAVSR